MVGALEKTSVDLLLAFWNHAMQYKALIFDLDGTLLDTLTDLAESGNRVLATMGFPTHPVSAYRTFVGSGLRTLIARILPEESKGASVYEEAVQRFQDDYSRNWSVNSVPYEGIHEMLDSLDEIGCPISILSNKPHEFTRLCVNHFFPGRSFHLVLGLRPEVPKKPDPSGALEIVGSLDSSPAETLFIGDSSIDMVTALNAGMDAVGVTWGFRTVDELREGGAKFLIDKPSELVKIVQ